ncbi:MAG: ribosome recycling factor [Prevotella sp.]|nr:ribosome recycling factor [Prevotella sp.]
MNSYYYAQLKDFTEKARGYNMMFNYRMMNLCVKAEPGALVPVIVTVGGKDYNLEEVAQIRRPDDYIFEIRANNSDYLQNIIDGIMDVHPEFVFEMKTEKDIEEKDVNYAQYTMPEVDKDRYDLLSETTKAFYNECLVSIDAVYAQKEAKLAEVAVHAPAEDVQQIKDELDEYYHNAKDEAQKMRDMKLQEIEEAYLHYQEKEQDREIGKINSFDYSQGMRLDQDE